MQRELSVAELKYLMSPGKHADLQPAAASSVCNGLTSFADQGLVACTDDAKQVT